MLSLLHKKQYQEFLTLLTILQNHFDNAENSDKIAEIFSDLKKYVEREIITLTDEGLDITVINLWRSLQTEIQREFRLLNTDMLFLASSRTDSTKKKRINSIKERLEKLITYCQTILSS